MTRFAIEWLKSFVFLAVMVAGMVGIGAAIMLAVSMWGGGVFVVILMAVAVYLAAVMAKAKLDA